MRWMQRHQVALYVAGIALGAVVGLVWPGVAPVTEPVITVVLALLLYATFLGIPFGALARAFRDWRFLSTVLAVNVILVPLVVWPLSRIVAGDQDLLVGVLFVLLTPCVDYVIVFSALAGGDERRLLAATPVLMLAQILLLPLYLWLFAGSELVGAVELSPFVRAFVVVIALPLVAAGITHLAAARSRLGRRVRRSVTHAMVPLVVATLAVVVSSQVATVGNRIDALLHTVPVYLLFAAIMVALGTVISRRTSLDVPGQRAAVFSGVTRNSLVVLPLVLALPAGFDLAPLAVVTQTLVELAVMVACIKLVPRLLPDPPADRTADASTARRRP